MTGPPNPSRRAFLAFGGGLALTLAACGDDDADPPPVESGAKSGGDIDIANYALTLEHLEADFYERVIESGVLDGQPAAEVAALIGRNEQEHVDALTQTVRQLGGTPVAAPATTFDAVVEAGPEKVLETAAIVENLGAAAYLGQARNIESREVLAAALAIHSNEARHAAALNLAVGRPLVATGAFARPASKDQVLAQINPFLA